MTRVFDLRWHLATIPQHCLSEPSIEYIWKRKTLHRIPRLTENLAPEIWEKFRMITHWWGKWEDSEAYQGTTLGNREINLERAGFFSCIVCWATQLRSLDTLLYMKLSSHILSKCVLILRQTEYYTSSIHFHFYATQGKLSKKALLRKRGVGA